MSERIQWYAPPRRAYSRRELLVDRCVNFLGAALSWVGTALLCLMSIEAGDPVGQQLCFVAFGVGLITMFNCSALYHHQCWDWAKTERLFSIDKIGINAMIMGCYAPCMIICDAYLTLAFVWVLGTCGLVLEVWTLCVPTDVVQSYKESDRSKNVRKQVSLARYLLMGWAVLPVAPEVFQSMGSWAAHLSVAGGLLYTIGVPFFVHSQLEFHTAIWHTFVLVASACFYAVMALGLVGRENTHYTVL